MLSRVSARRRARSAASGSAADPGVTSGGRGVGRVRAAVLAGVVPMIMAIALPGAAAADPVLPGLPVVPTVPAAPTVADPAAPAAADTAVPAVPASTGAAVPDVAAPATPEPQTPDEARERIRQVQHEAEALTEQWHAATDDFTARQEEADRLRAAVEPLRAAADRARADEETYRSSIDGITLSYFENGRLDQFNALLASPSPQAYLDQMSALETLTADRLVALDELRGKVDEAARTQADADAATTKAQSAADAAKQAADQIAARKADADRRIDEAEQLLRRLSPAEIADLNGPSEDAPDILLGTGAGVDALRAAATRLGKPYAWGASGPNRFDCSGLTSWAFRQAGITLPRSSSAQSQIGTPVAWADMEPGDLVFYYSPVSHVGIYAGGGKMINAPQSGDVVKYQTVSRTAFTGARRI